MASSGGDPSSPRPSICPSMASQDQQSAPDETDRGRCNPTLLYGGGRNVPLTLAKATVVKQIVAAADCEMARLMSVRKSGSSGTHRTTSSTVRSKNFAVPTPAWKKSIPRLDNDFAKEIPTKETTSCWAGVAAPSRTAVESKMRDFVQIFLLKQNNFNFILLKESAAGIAWLRSRQPTRRRFVQRRRPGA